MKKKYDKSEIIKIVDKAFVNFEEEMKSKGKTRDDSEFNVMLTMVKLAIIGEIMSILKEEN